jgi:hypothetical protein
MITPVMGAEHSDSRKRAKQATSTENGVWPRARLAADEPHEGRQVGDSYSGWAERFHPVADCDSYTGVQHLQDDHPDGDRLKPEAPSRRKWNDADDRERDAPRAGIKRQCSYLSIRSWN